MFILLYVYIYIPVSFRTTDIRKSPHQRCGQWNGSYIYRIRHPSSGWGRIEPDRGG